MKKEQKARSMGVEQIGNREHIFSVHSPSSGNTYHPIIKVACDCRYMGVQGVANGGLCSHCIAALRSLTGDDPEEWEKAKEYEMGVLRGQIKRLQMSLQVANEHIHAFGGLPVQEAGPNEAPQ